MTKLMLVRHGETLWNYHARYQGHTDIELSDAGRGQAELLSRRLADQPLQAVYASDLRRALETASIIARPHDLDVQTLPELREINFGAWEGLTYNEIRGRFSDLVDSWHASPATIQIPDGETFQDLASRAYGAVEDLVKKHDSATIAVVAHGGTIRAIVCALLGIDLNHLFRIRQDNGALNIIDFYENYGILSLLNDTHHFEPAAACGPGSVFNR